MDDDLHLKQPLTQVALWCFGEYGDLINEQSDVTESSEDGLDKVSEENAVNASIAEPEYSSDLLIDITNALPASEPSSPIGLGSRLSIKSDESNSEGENELDADIARLNHNRTMTEFEPVNEEDIVNRCYEILLDSKINLPTREYAINAMFKLSARFPDQSPHIKVLIDRLTTDLNLELQQRSIEFSTIFSRHEDKLSAIFERMPPIDKASAGEEEEKDPDETRSTEEDLLQGDGPITAEVM